MKFTILCLNSYFMNKKTTFQSIMIGFLIMIIITNSPLAFSELQISNTIGTLQLNQDYFEITRQPNEMIKVYGNVNNHVEGDKVTIVFTLPDGTNEGQQLFPTQSGYFETFLILDNDSQEGTYSVFASLNSEMIGSLSFVVENKKFSMSDNSIQPPQIRSMVDPVIVTTDKNSYADGEKIKISGEVGDLLSGTPVTIQIISANGNIVGIDQLEVGADHKFSKEVTTGGELWKLEGTYTIKVLYGTQARTAETNFVFSSSGLGETTPKTSGSSVNTNPQAKTTYYDTSLSLRVADGSSQGNIKVYPELTYGSGDPLSTSDVEIFVDGNYKTKLSSNQWSNDIWAGSGSHTIKASVAESYDSSDSSIKFKAVSYTETFVVQTASGVSSNTSDQVFPIEYVIAVIAIAAIAGLVIALSKRKKATPKVIVSPAKTPSPFAPQAITQDDTQFWVCPHCGGDTQYRSGKQYCSKCNVYL